VAALGRILARVPLSPTRRQSPGRALRHGARHRAHAPDEYYLIESTHPKVQGLDGAIASFVEYLYALA